MEEPRPGSGNATDESFEHVDLDHSPAKNRGQAAAAPAAAGAAEQPPAAPTQPPAAPAGEQSSAGAADAAPAAPAPAVDAAAAAAEAPSSPPATRALQSVLGFFTSIAGSPQPPAKEQKEAPAAGATAPPPQPSDAAGSEQAAAEAATGSAAAAAEEETYDPVAAFESEALEAAERLQHGVEEVGQKLLHGAAEAKESLTSFAQGLSSWWSQLDAAAQGGSAPQSRSASSKQLAADVAAAAEQLGLDSGETALESFACRLLQSYTSVSNFFTPVQQIPFPGSLHITSARLCFVFEDKSIAPIKLPAKAIKAGGVTKLPADSEKGLPVRLEVALEAQGQKLVLADFALAELELDSALALLEHLAELADG